MNSDKDYDNFPWIFSRNIIQIGVQSFDII